MLYGGAGDDNVYGGAGNDTLYGDAGTDTLSGGGEDDLLFGGDGDDRMTGDMGYLFNGSLLVTGDDWLDGEAGNDWLQGEAGDDSTGRFSHNPTAFGFTPNLTPRMRMPNSSPSPARPVAPWFYAFGSIDRHNHHRYTARHSNPAVGTGGHSNVRLNGLRDGPSREMSRRLTSGNDGAWVLVA